MHTPFSEQLSKFTQKSLKFSESWSHPVRGEANKSSFIDQLGAKIAEETDGPIKPVKTAKNRLEALKITSDDESDEDEDEIADLDSEEIEDEEEEVSKNEFVDDEAEEVEEGEEDSMDEEERK